MSVTERPSAPVQPNKASARQLPRPLAWGLGLVREECGYLRRGLTSWPLFVLVIVAGLLFGLAYQTRLDFAVKLGPQNVTDYLYVASFNKPESNDTGGFRWSSDDNRIRFPGVGRLTSAQLQITMQVGGRPANLGPARVQVWHENRLLGEIEVGPGLQTYTFNYTAEGRKLDGNLTFALRVPNAFRDATHNLPLGVVVSEVRLVGGTDGKLVIPALSHLAFSIVGLILIYLLLVRSGWSPLLAAGLTSVPMLGIAAAIAFVRLQYSVAVEPTFMVIALSYPLLVLGLRVTAQWLPNLPTAHARWLGLLFAAAFVVKAGGMAHPAFQVIDHWFRVHQIERFWLYPGDFWQQYFNVSAGTSVTGSESGSAVLGQWGLKFAIPYSPLVYILAAPFALIWPDHNPNLLAAVNALAAWLEASSIFLIYIIVSRANDLRLAKQASGNRFQVSGGEDADSTASSLIQNSKLMRHPYGCKTQNYTGVVAAALFAFYPLSFLLFSDGGYNSIFAQWLTLLFIAQLFGLVNYSLEFKIQNSKFKIALASLTLGAAMLAHTATFLMITTLVLVLIGVWAVRKETRAAAKLLAVIGAVALAIAMLLYYGYYVVGLVSQALPAIGGKISGGIGQDNRKLGTDLLTGFWPQLWEHFRLFPFVLTVIALAVLWRKRESWLVWSVWFSWLIVFGLFALADLKINLLQKHMLFAAPLLCIGSGLAFSVAWDYVKQKRPQWSWLVPTVATLLIVFLAWQGLSLWYGRVYYYLLPPGSG